MLVESTRTTNRQILTLQQQAAPDIAPSTRVLIQYKYRTILCLVLHARAAVAPVMRLPSVTTASVYPSMTSSTVRSPRGITILSFDTGSLRFVTAGSSRHSTKHTRTVQVPHTLPYISLRTPAAAAVASVARLRSETFGSCCRHCH